MPRKITSAIETPKHVAIQLRGDGGAGKTYLSAIIERALIRDGFALTREENAPHRRQIYDKPGRSVTVLESRS
jgi:hypothetical protein